MPEEATVLDLPRGWSILQDVHHSGEKLAIYRRDWNPLGIGQCVSPWQLIERLDYLQLLFAEQPYFGRELRYFNQAPWWYRLEFPTPDGAKRATLRFDGVDYYAKVWLNETLLGEHEGYAEPFEFEVGHLLSRDTPNLLIVQVSSPWDERVVPGEEDLRCWQVLRGMLKGTYEHDDTFVQRDVNPIGIWRPVRLIVHQGLRSAEPPHVATAIAAEGARATVSVDWPVALDEGPRQAEFRLRVVAEADGRQVARASAPVRLEAGTTALRAAVDVEKPALWNTWDRGGAALYRADLEIVEGGTVRLARSVSFGIRDVAVRRTPDETTFLLNGRPIYLRGATYWPDLYISRSDRGRYERDVAAAVRAGINALRIHVHTENDEFYEVCDRLGVLVLQDFDLNWAFPTDEAFVRRAVAVFGAMVRRLRNHPAILAWICMNEASGEQPRRRGGEPHGCDVNVRPGRELAAEAHRLDPGRPIIKNSGYRDDPDSGDNHDYTGSLGGGHYTEIRGRKEKLVTEFGIDAPPAPERACLVPRIAERLKEVLPRTAELHDYQYHLIKFYIEQYRMQKYAPCSGYFQFMWIDFCPQSFYGVYDYWGCPKAEGIGGGLRAMEESNLPVGLFMEYGEGPIVLHAVNDLPDDLGPCEARWTVTAPDGAEIASGTAELRLGPDSHVRVCDLAFPVAQGARINVALTLAAADGRVLARNVYRDPFNPPPHPAGHPLRMDHEIGMRLWWAM